MAGEPSVLVAPVDADARGLADGQLVCLRSANGSLTVPVHRSDDAPWYAVLISNWWTNDFPGGNGGQRSHRPGAHGPRWRLASRSVPI